MTLQPSAKRYLILGSALLALGVLIGAFGAHWIRARFDDAKILTFETGVRYHFFHAFGIFVTGILHQLFPDLKAGFSVIAFFAGIILFSFNCYLYVVTGMKIFAMIVPLGGVLYIAGWVFMTYRLLKLR